MTQWLSWRDHIPTKWLYVTFTMTLLTLTFWAPNIDPWVFTMTLHAPHNDSLLPSPWVCGCNSTLCVITVTNSFLALCTPFTVNLCKPHCDFRCFHNDTHNVTHALIMSLCGHLNYFVYPHNEFVCHKNDSLYDLHNVTLWPSWWLVCPQMTLYTFTVTLCALTMTLCGMTSLWIPSMTLWLHNDIM